MSNHLPGSAAWPQRRASSRWRLAVLSCLGLLLLIVAGVGGLAYWGYLKFLADRPGLGGVWHDPTDPKHTYRFRANGAMDAWYGGLLMDRFLT